MVNIQVKLKRVGNSLGIVVPSNIVNQKGLKEGEELIVNIQNKKKTTVEDMLREAMKQRLRFKRNTEEILREIDEDSD